MRHNLWRPGLLATLVSLGLTAEATAQTKGATSSVKGQAGSTLWATAATPSSIGSQAQVTMPNRNCQHGQSSQANSTLRATSGGQTSTFSTAAGIQVMQLQATLTQINRYQQANQAGLIQLTAAQNVYLQQMKQTVTAQILALTR